MVFKKKYNIYKILISYIFLQAIIECFCGICTSLHEEDNDDLILKVSGWVGNYELINNGYKLFQKFNIMLSVLDICIDKNTFEKSILYISEILCLNKLMLKKIIINNNKSQVFYKLNQFEFSYDINFKISLSKSTCFEFEDNIFKIEKSIYSINSAVHADKPLQETPILNIDALLIEDYTEYKVNKDYLQITKGVIKSRLNKKNRVWESILKKTYLKDTLKQIKSLNIQIARLGYGGGVEYLKQLKHLKYKLRELAVQFSADLEEFETILLLQYLEYEICNLSMYFIFFLDFRGRMYTISTYGPISNKIIRNILVYNTNNPVGDYQNENKDSQTFKIIKDNYFSKLNTIKLKNDSDLFKCSLF